MISSQEREYLQEFAKSEYSGQGEIVDLGCWLGASTIALAVGLSGNLNLKVREPTIHAYDIFIWEAWMYQFVVDTPIAKKYRPGDNFFNECIEQTLPWKNQIQFYPGDIKQIGWKGCAIELLFIDAMKSWDLANSIIHSFFSALIPGRSIVVHQDFAHFYTYWIHLIMYRLQDYFEPIYDVPHSWSFVFKYCKLIPDKLLKYSYSLSSFSRSEIDAAFNYSMQLVSGEKRPQIVGAKVMALMHLGDLQQAQLELEKAKAEGMSTIDLELPLGMSFPSVIIDFFASRQSHEEDSQTRLQQTQAELEQLHSQLQQTQTKLEQLQTSICTIESSKIWKLRIALLRLKQLFG